MKTTHQVLHDLNVARLLSEKEERKWTQLKRECQSPAVLGFTWLGGLLVTSLIGALWLRSHHGDWKGLPLELFASVLVMAPGVLITYQRKQKVPTHEFFRLQLRNWHVVDSQARGGLSDRKQSRALLLE